MKSRRLLLAGGTVAWAAIGVVRRNRRPAQVPHKRRALPAPVALPVAVVVVGGPWFAWDAGRFVGQIWNVTGIIWDQVKDAVFAVVNAAAQILAWGIDALEWSVGQTFEAVFGTIDYISDKVTTVANAVGGVIVDTYEMLDATLSNFRDQVKAVLEHAWDGIYDWVQDNIFDWIHSAVGEIWDLFGALVDLGIDGLMFLINFVTDPINFLWALLSDVVTDAIDAALETFDFGLDILTKIWHILEWLASHADEITEQVLSTLWDILKWFIDHIDDFTVDALDGIFDLSPETFAEKMIAAMESNRSGIEEKFASWLG